MNYQNLQSIVQSINAEVLQLNILSRRYWYSPLSRKLKPQEKIGAYTTRPHAIQMGHGCKYIMVFHRSTFHMLQSVINKHLPEGVAITYREDFKSSEDIGFDVYQKVENIKLYIEPNSISSKTFTLQSMLKRDVYWEKCQTTALKDVEPPLSDAECNRQKQEVQTQFSKLKAYMESTSDANYKVCVRRNSGFRHRMIRTLPEGDLPRQGFSDLVLIFSSSDKFFPTVDLPKPPKRDRKSRSDSIAAQYKANPSSFKYYDKFGIFEVYDR